MIDVFGFGGFGLGIPAMSYIGDTADPYGLEDQRRRLAPVNLPSSDLGGPHSSMTSQYRPHGFLLPQVYGGQVLSVDDARRARAQGFAALGQALLAHAAEPGGIGAGLSEGFQGMNRAMAGSLENDRRLRIEQEEIERRRSEDTRRHEREDYELSKDKTQFGEWQAQRDRGYKLRAATGRSAGEMVANIEHTAGADSPEARQARALAALGEDADLNRLAVIDDNVTTRARRPEDAKLETGFAVERQEALHNAPSAQREERRAEAYLGVAQRNADQYGGGGKQPTTAQRANDIEQEINALTEPLIRAKSMNGMIPISPAAVSEIRAGARDLAARNVDERYRAFGVSGPTGGPDTSHYTPSQKAAYDAIQNRLGSLDERTRAAVNSALNANEDPVAILHELPASKEHPQMAPPSPTATIPTGPMGPPGPPQPQISFANAPGIGAPSATPKLSQEQAAAAIRLRAILPSLPLQVQGMVQRELAAGQDPVAVLARYGRLGNP